MSHPTAFVCTRYNALVSCEKYRQRFRTKRRGASPGSTLWWASCSFCFFICSNYQAKRQSGGSAYCYDLRRLSSFVVDHKVSGSYNSRTVWPRIITKLYTGIQTAQSTFAPDMTSSVNAYTRSLSTTAVIFWYRVIRAMWYDDQTARLPISL